VRQTFPFRNQPPDLISKGFSLFFPSQKIKVESSKIEGANTNQWIDTRKSRAQSSCYFLNKIYFSTKPNKHNEDTVKYKVNQEDKILKTLCNPRTIYSK